MLPELINGVCTFRSRHDSDGSVTASEAEKHVVGKILGRLDFGC